MKAIDFFKFINENEIEFHWGDNELNQRDVILFPSFFHIEKMDKLLKGTSLYDDGIPCKMKDGYFVFWASEILDTSELNYRKYLARILADPARTISNKLSKSKIMTAKQMRLVTAAAKTNPKLFTLIALATDKGATKEDIMKVVNQNAPAWSMVRGLCDAVADYFLSDSGLAVIQRAKANHATG